MTSPIITLTSMKIAHSNINSTRNKIDDISVELSDYDIICISEIKLDDQIPTTSLLIDSYNNPIRKDRNINNGGGLIISIKNNICYKHRPGVDFTKGFKTWHKFSTEIRFMLIPIIVLFIAHEFITGKF